VAAGAQAAVTWLDIYDDDPPLPSPFAEARGQDIDPGSGDSA
jgi:hypothetical protein